MAQPGEEQAALYWRRNLSLMIVCFVVLIFYYTKKLAAPDKEFNVDQD